MLVANMERLKADTDSLLLAACRDWPIKFEKVPREDDLSSDAGTNPNGKDRLLSCRTDQ